MPSETEAFQAASERLTDHLDKHPAPPGMRYDFVDTMEVHHNDPNGLVRATVQVKLVPDDAPAPARALPTPKPKKQTAE